MKNFLIILFVSVCLFTNAQYGMLNGNGYAPDFSVTDLNSNSHNLYSYLDSGYVVVVELLSVTCGHCIQYSNGTENSYQTNGSNGTNVARFIGLEINSSTSNIQVSSFATNHNTTFPLCNNISPTLINYQLY